jgi:glycosyltransferase involved in cell wall biosynthesis
LKGPGGILAATEDVEGLRDGMVRILENPVFARELGECGRRSVVENYSLELHVQKYIALFQEKIEEKAARRA